MLDVINGLANGWVVAPVVDAFARRGLFDMLAEHPMRVETLVRRYSANEGHLRTALRLLYESGWLDAVEPDCYAANARTGLVSRMPSESADLAGLPIAREVEGAQAAWSGRLAKCTSGWSGSDPALAGLLDGAVLAPLLAGLYEVGTDGLEQDAPKGWSESVWQAARAVFVERGWGVSDGATFRLTPPGRSLLAGSGALGTVLSYAAMFGRMDELLFGDAAAVFDAGGKRDESHVDRALNVVASGVQHQSHFAELEALVVRLFDDLPLERQPRYVADMGCGDGTLLRRIYEVVRTRTARGQALAGYPLTLIGADYNALALEASGRTLAGLPHLLMQGDVSEPQQMLADLAARGITQHDQILHVRSFLDHDRPFRDVEDASAVQARAGLSYSGEYVARDGSAIAPAEAVEALVEHLRRWRGQIAVHGLVLLEVHCLRPATVRRLQNQTESLHFDAYHAFSGQQLVEASVFLMAAAEAGLFPERGTSRLIPKTADFTRISLHRLLAQPYRVRHPRRSDLTRLAELDRLCVPEALRTPGVELERRIAGSAQTQMVLEKDGQIVGALYAQRIASIEVLRCCLHRDLAQLEQAEGQVPVMEMGLSSLELLELRRLLSGKMEEALDATFFFSYGTAAAMMAYFAERAAARLVAESSAASGPVISTGTQAKESPVDDAPADGAIAIIGLACRLPGDINDPDQFWQALMEGREVVGALPAERHALRGRGGRPFRWQGGFLDEVDRFDAGFFRISPREAEWLDPQQRLLLEVSWEALERAGIGAWSLRGSRSGVFVGMMGSDYQHLLAQRDNSEIEAHFASGNACSVAAGRVSYFLDWQGPALSIDTACSSSLVAVHTACRSLLSGECRLALAAGVNLLLDEKVFEAYEKAGMLSPEGRCKTFDASADGYVRAEGCGALILKRLADAQADGDCILAVIRGSAINQDGSGSGLTAPNQRAQQAVIEAALAQAGIAGSTIDYLEAHGTGTSLGDPIEVMAAAEVLGRDRSQAHPLLIGSVKSALGHLEAAAGITGLIKTVLSIQHELLPAQLHFSAPNPHIPWERLPVGVVSTTQKWPAGPRRASVSSFGFSGTNAHVIVEGYSAPAREVSALSGPVVVVLSARSADRLQVQVERLLAYLQQHEVNLTELAYTLQAGREAFEVRLALVVNSVEELKHKLTNLSQNKTSPEGVYRGEIKRGRETLSVLAANEELQEAIGKLIARGKVGQVAKLWVQGLALDWGALYGERKPHRLSLPTYPFAPERYWAPASAGIAGVAQLAQLHPLVHRNTSDLGEQRYSTTLSGEESFLRDHLVQGRRTVPGVAQLEWARAAVSLALGQESSIRLEQVKWLRPLVVESALEVHIGLMEEAPGRISYEIYSGQGEEAVVYSHGYGVVRQSSEASQLDLAALVAQCPRTLSGAEIYEQSASLGIEYGPSFRVLKELHVGDGLAVGVLEVGSGTEAEGYLWPPSLVDGALQASLAPLPAQARLELPFAVQTVEQWAAVPNSAWVVVRAAKGDSAAVRKMDVAIVNGEGRMALQLSGFSARPLQEIGSGGAWETIPAVPQWREQAMERLSQNETLDGAQDDPMAPQIERALKGLIAAHLKLPPGELDRDAPLKEFGFDSITLMSFGEALNERYGLELSPTVFFEAATIGALAAYLVREHRAALAGVFEPTVEKAAATSLVAETAVPVTGRRRGRRGSHANGSTATVSPLGTEPIAVIGISGCFPQAPDIETLWANLQAGRDCIGELPPNRWGRSPTPAIRHAGVVEGMECFDPLFFGISPREAIGMDPQQRLLMQYVYRVIEDAGHSVESLSGSSTALLVGTFTSGYGQLLAQSGEPISGYSAAGVAGSMGPNRMSYWLNWHGPSEPVDTACSSSLVAIHRAIGLLRSGQCDQAVVGGVNTLLSMEAHESFTQAGMLSPQGRCRTFSAQADGYVRGEGVGMLFLKPLRAAERDGDHVYGLILGSAENHGGRANSLTAPNPVAQAQLIETAFRQAGVDPRTVGYVEAHGTGTSLGDPVEVQGLKQAFRALAAESVLVADSCGLGTVKSNIGHLEFAAGVAGVIKVLLQLQHRQLVASLNSEPRNPHIDLSDSPFYVVTENRKWEAPLDAQGRELPRRAGVSSFGFGGVNAHVVLEEYVGPAREPVAAKGPVAVVLSARSDERLQVQVDQLLGCLEQHEVNLADLAYTLQVGREACEVRLAVVANTVEELTRKLAGVRQKKISPEGVGC